MKKLIIILAIVFMAFTASTAFGATNVSLQWDANTESDLAGYKIYRSAVSGVYSSGAEVGDVAAPTVQFTDNNVPDGTWFWVATAYDTFGNESEYSNEVTDTLNTEPPAPPQNLSIWQKILAWIWHFFSRWA